MAEQNPVAVTMDDINLVLSEDPAFRLRVVNAALARERESAMSRVAELERQLEGQGEEQNTNGVTSNPEAAVTSYN
tara:strand:- start:20 stop:247 length:228 start_codon:yes stop_codon:yes gene_type:complete